MTRFRCKDLAESILRELPSVLGAHVREDVHGHPREVHLLVAHGPDTRELAHDIREMLEDRLGVPVDQRVISIAQLSDQAHRAHQQEVVLGTGRTAEGTGAEKQRVTFREHELLREAGNVRSRVNLAYNGHVFSGEATEVDSDHGLIQATAKATLAALQQACDQSIQLQVDAGSLVRAFERDYVLVAVLAGSPQIGRTPLLLSGAHPLEDGLEHATVLSTLKATNRVFERGLAQAFNSDKEED